MKDSPYKFVFLEKAALPRFSPKGGRLSEARPYCVFWEKRGNRTGVVDSYSSVLTEGRKGMNFASTGS